MTRKLVGVVADHVVQSGVETPWQRQGTVVNGAMKSSDAIAQAKLDWDVELRQSGWFADGKFFPAPNQMHIVRTDVNLPLGTSTIKYNPLQNKVAFSFLDDVLGHPEIAAIECAGLLNEGRCVWVQMRIPTLEFEVFDGDVVRDYITIFNSHAADRVITVVETPIRIVSGTTANRSLRGGKGRLKIRHTSGMLSKLRSGAEMLRAEIAYFQEWQQQATVIAKQRYTEQQALQFALDVIQGPRIIAGGDAYEAATDILDLQAKQRVIAERIMELIESGKGTDIPGVRGSGWGLYNAVTEYVDHYGLEATGRGGNRPIEDKRIEYMMFGNGADMKDRALVWLLHGREMMLGK